MVVGRLSCLAPAKVNLTLRVLGRRADGYHAIESLMLPVSLCDRVDISVASSRLPRVRCRVDGPERVAGGASNLAALAARRVLQASGAVAQVSIALTKHVPAAAGLGGGSSDAAAVLNALPKLLGVRLSRQALARLAAGIGADVGFFLGCRPAWAEGLGDELTPVAGLSGLHLALVVPKVRVSTAWAYAHALPKRAQRRLGGDLTSARRATTRGERLPFDAEAISSCVFNDFERGVKQAFADVARISGRLRQSGAAAVVMSGSGSAVVGVFASAAAATRAVEGFSGPDKGFAVRVVGRRPAVRP